MLKGQPPGSTYDLTLAYKIEWDPKVLGACGVDEWHDKIKTGYSETLDLIGAAREAIESLKHPRPPKSSRTMREYYSWERKAQTVETFFGASTPPETSGIGTAGEEVLQTYTQLLEAHVHTPSDRKRRLDLRCGDGWIKWHGPDEVDPFDPEHRKIRDIPAIGDKGRREGTFVVHPTVEGVGYFQTNRLKAINPLCNADNREGGIVGASSWPLGYNTMTLCPTLLDKSIWSVEAMRSAFLPGDGLDMHTSLVARCWLHELGHLILRMEDPHAVDVNGQPVFDRSTRKPKAAYGVRPSHYLASYHPQVARKSPENFALFACAMYWDHFWWSHGVAWPMDQDGAPLDPETKQSLDMETGKPLETSKTASKKAWSFLGGSSRKST